MGSQFKQKNKNLACLKRRSRTLKKISEIGMYVSSFLGGLLILYLVGEAWAARGQGGYPHVDLKPFLSLIPGLCVFVVFHLWYKVVVLQYEKVKKESIKSPGNENSVVEELLDSVTDDNLRTTISILGDIGNTRGASLCIDALRNLDWKTRSEALDALTKIRADFSRDPIFDVLNDSDSFIRKKAVEAIDECGWKPKNDTENISYLMAKREWAQLLKFERLAVEPLIKMLKDKDKDTRLNAAIIIGKFKDHRVIEPLIEALKDKEDEVKKQARVSLKTVTGKSFFGLSGQKQWREWWEVNREVITRDWEKP